MIRAKFTPEQDRILRQMWGAGAPTAEIVEAVNAASGTSYTQKQIQSRAGVLSLSRSPGHQAAMLRLAYASGRSPRGGRPTKAVAAVIQVPQRELIRLGREFGLSVSLAMDVQAVSRAARKADRAHPGFMVVRLATRRVFV